MRYIAAYLLATLGNPKKIDAETITGILQAGGIEVDKDKVLHLLKEMEGKDVNELLKAGTAKLATVATAGPAATTVVSKTEEKKVEAKKEEKVKEPEPEAEEEDMSGLMDFF